MPMITREELADAVAVDGARRGALEPPGATIITVASAISATKASSSIAP